MSGVTCSLDIVIKMGKNTTPSIKKKQTPHPMLGGSMLNAPVNSYGHVGTVSSPNHTFSSASLTMRLASTSCTNYTNQRKGGEWPYKLFYDISPRKYGTGIELATPGSAVRHVSALTAVRHVAGHLLQCM